MSDITVLEFATRHVESQPCTVPVKWHVDLIAKYALDRDRALWSVVTDEDGHHSLLWLPMDERVWQKLFDDAIESKALDELIERTFPG